MESDRSLVFLAPAVDGIDLLPDAAGVYCITNRVNGRRYVGTATKSILQRCLQHRSDLRQGRSPNIPMRRDAVLYGHGVFFFFAFRIDAFEAAGRKAHLDNLEIWFCAQLCAHDERFGYNLEAGHARTQAARFRDRERKLMRRNSEKYELLPGIDMYDPINLELLRSWLPGS